MISKERFWSKRPNPEADGPWDAIVIGSGMGGMTTAAMLARLGKRVLVLEQHYTPGGFTHEFRRSDGYTWDVGVHAIGQVTTRSLTGRVLNALTKGRLEWASLGKVYESFEFPDGLKIEFPDNPKQFRANLLEAFPGQGEAIDEFLSRAKAATLAMQSFYLSRTLPQPLSWLVETLLARDARQAHAMTVEQVLDEITDDPRLRAVLVSQWGYYGAPPSKASFSAQALVTRHYTHGGFYPVGGSSSIARELLRTVAESGGWTRISTPVESLLMEQGRCVGVVIEGGEEIKAEKVISAVGIQSTIKRLLPAHYAAQPWAKSIASIKPAAAHVCLYLGFKGDIRQAGASGANRWFYESWDMEQEVWRVPREQETWERAPVLYCSFPSLKDPLHEAGPELKHTGEVVTFVPWESFEPWADAKWRHRGPEYEAYKERIKAVMLKQLFEHMPELEPMLEVAELSTPASTQHFTRPMSGSIYGLEPTPARFANPHLRPHSPIPGLWFSGSEVTLGGVMGAMLGGMLAAIAAEPWGSIKFLRQHAT